MTTYLVVRVTAEQLIAVCLTAAALIAALGYLARKLRRLLEVVAAAYRLLQLELEHNHGGSIKDDITGMAISIGRVDREVTDLRSDFDEHVKKGRRP